METFASGGHKEQGRALRPWKRAGLWASAAAALALAGCGTFSAGNTPLNAALTNNSGTVEGGASSPLVQDTAETAIGLSFSGGGTRASAFAFGVLQELAKTEETRNGMRTPLIDRVSLVSGVSGGSVTAAYFALHGRDTLSDFRRKFLIQDVEASLNTSVNVTNLMRMAKGGVNGRDGLPTWLDQNLFHGATFTDVLKPGLPRLWINASDIYNRTTFIYNQTNFGALCSDLRRYPLSEAVAASAAVPFIFAPIVIENYADKCHFNAPDWVDSADRPGAPAILRASAAAIQRYREKNDVKFVKLLDGGMTDNLGLSGFVLELAAATKPYEPLTPRQAVNLRRFLFVVVDAGLLPGGESRPKCRFARDHGADRGCLRYGGGFKCARGLRCLRHRDGKMARAPHRISLRADAARDRGLARHDGRLELPRSVAAGREGQLRGDARAERESAAR